jgi:hypothetical protein
MGPLQRGENSKRLLSTKEMGARAGTSIRVPLRTKGMVAAA